LWCSQCDDHPENNLAKFLKRILWCSQFDNHPENNLAKFGCILDTKFRKKKNRILLYSWLPSGTYHSNLMIWNCFSFEIWRIWVIYSMKNHKCMDQNHFFQVEKFAKNSPVKKNHCCELFEGVYEYYLSHPTYNGS